MLTNFFNLIGDNISYTAVIVSGVILFNFSFYYFWKHSSIFGNDILSPINTSNSSLFEPSTLSSEASSLISRSSSLSSGSTTMQLTPTVSSNSHSNFLSTQFQFHNYNPNWFFDLTRQLKAKDAFNTLNEQDFNNISLEYCRSIVDKFPNQMYMGWCIIIPSLKRADSVLSIPYLWL